MLRNPWIKLLLASITAVIVYNTATPVIFIASLLWFLPAFVVFSLQIFFKDNRSFDSFNHLGAFRVTGFFIGLLIVTLMFKIQEPMPDIIFNEVDDEAIIVITLASQEQIVKSKKPIPEEVSEKKLPDTPTDIKIIKDEETIAEEAVQQDNDEDIVLEQYELDSRPKVEGGNLYEELNNRINYPVIARELGIEGTVIVEFIVTKSGKIRDIKILKSLGGGCDNEVIRVLKNMPRLHPAIKDGKPVSSKMILPIRFTMK